MPFGVLSKTAFLLASVFGKVGEEDGDSATTMDQRQRLSITTQYQLRLMTSLQARAIAERDDFVMFVSRHDETVMGVLTVSLGLSASGAKNYGSAEIFQGARVYSLCNMAVREEFRRRGVATRMLQRAEEYVSSKNTDGLEIAMVLSVDKYNEDAQRLYQEIGYRIDEAWEDPRWLESIERGSVDVPRRILMWKRLHVRRV
jgi:ribosomal protein S18 acetylase RimI-like enzyme